MKDFTRHIHVSPLGLTFAVRHRDNHAVSVSEKVLLVLIVLLMAGCMVPI